MSAKRLRSRMVIAVICMLAIAVIGASQLPAQESEEAKSSTQSISLLDTMKKAGTIGWAIVFLSVVAVSLAVEHAISIRRSALMPMPTVLRIRALLKRRDFEGLRDFCEEDSSFVAKVIGAGVAEPRSTYDEVEEAMVEAGGDQTARLYRKIEYLSLIGNVAPMLGLLGTVVGMIQAFNTIERTGGFAKPAELAGGISKALITTCEGLIVAIPALVIYVYFRNKIEQLSSEVAGIGEELMRPLRQRGKKEDYEEDDEDVE